MQLAFLSILLATLSGVDGGADARPQTVIDVMVGEGYRNATAEFAINPEDGRAWVEAAVDNGGLGDDFDSQSLRSRVQGLAYDAQAGEILYQDHGPRVVCARVTTRRFVIGTQTHIGGTGRCVLAAHLEHRSDDNGFEHAKNKHLVVELTVTR